MSEPQRDEHLTFTRLTAHEALLLAAEADAARVEGRDPRAELRQRLSALKERRERHRQEEWDLPSTTTEDEHS